MSRSVVMERATRWVDAVVPYSQTGWADRDGALVESSSLGWRRDCSGFASMCWNLPRPGASTRTLASYADRIQKESLQPGDLLLKSGEHAVIFGGWVDETRTEYWAYEMSASQSAATGDGSRRRKTPYPYWRQDYGYLPYRLRGIADSIDYSDYVTGVYGPDRYATAVAASQQGWAAGTARTVIVASGENWPDALGAAALAGAVEGPVLLTPASALPGAVGAEIRRLGATEAVVVGGERAVSPAVLAAIEAIGSVETTRIGGGDRYETSALVAREAVSRGTASARPADDAVFVATGRNFPDALAAAPIAYTHVRPILLTEPSELSEVASATISDLGCGRAVILGGTGAISSQVQGDLGDLLGNGKNVSRIAGSDRYLTAIAVAAHAAQTCCLKYEGAVLANGAGFADALAGGVMAGRLGAPLLITPGDRLHPGVAGLLSTERTSIGYVRCLGGASAVAPIVRETIALTLQGG
jgi:putative cell wall-binding protein